MPFLGPYGALIVRTDFYLLFVLGAGVGAANRMEGGGGGPATRVQASHTPWKPLILLMDKILHDPKDPKLWELWYIPYNG